MATAQVGQVEITGEVRDPSGGIVPSAKVTVTEVRTNQVYTTVTGPGGVYTFNYLKPGRYKMGVEAPALSVSHGTDCRFQLESISGSTLISSSGEKARISRSQRTRLYFGPSRAASVK